MYKKIDEVLKKLLTYKNCGNIIVYTNGTIVPKEKNLNHLLAIRYILKFQIMGQFPEMLKN